MPVSRTFLQPTSMKIPPQGDYEYRPIILFLEDTTMAGLQAQLTAQVSAQELSEVALYVLEEIEYQVNVTKPAVGMIPAELNYSCMLWFSEAKKV